LPARTAYEYGPMARGASSVVMISFVDAIDNNQRPKQNLYFNRPMDKMKNARECL
jgi:hypothetical protein